MPKVMERGTSYFDRTILEQSATKAGAVQDPKRNPNTELFARYKFPGKGPVVYVKRESLNRMQSDTFHNPEHPWIEESTDLPSVIANLRNGPERLRVEMNNGELADLELAHGFILRFKGYAGQFVGQDPQGNILSEDALAAAEEALEKELPRLREWVFHLDEVIYTNGPELAARKMESNEGQRNRAEAASFDRQSEFFGQLLTKLSELIGGTKTPTADQLKETVKNLSPVQLQELIDHATKPETGKRPPVRL